jgi:hypothetical protein
MYLDKLLLSFIVIEFCVGLSSPIAGTLRSKYVPDAYQGAIMNIFRAPLNAVVVWGTYATDVFKHYGVWYGQWFIFISGSFANNISSGKPRNKKQTKKE